MTFKNFDRNYQWILHQITTKNNTTFRSSVSLRGGSLSIQGGVGRECLHSLGRTQFSTSETLGRMGTSFCCSGFWDRLGGHTLFMIGRSYSRQPLANHIAPKGCSHSPYSFWRGECNLLKDSPMTNNNRPVITSGCKQRVVTMKGHLTQRFLVTPEIEKCKYSLN